jgi:CotH kinase protein
MYVEGTLEVDGESYGPIGVRYKGSVGGFLPPCTLAGPGTAAGPKTGKCSIKVDFDRVDPDLRFHGLRKLNFHAMNRDKSMMRDRLGYAMFREFGVAAPRAVHARLSINGNFEGLFVVVEQIDGRFTRSRFSEGGRGNLYKEVWPVTDIADPYLAALETNEDDDPSVDKMLRFEAAIRDGADASLRWLDDHYLFDYIAADRIITNDDGAFHWYCSFNHNYYWYEAEHDDRMWIVPWDLDSSFQNPAGSFVHIAQPWNAAAPVCSCEQTGQMPASCDGLIGQWASRSDDYERSVDAFLDGPFAADNVESKLAAWAAQIDATVEEANGWLGAPSYDEWQENFAALHAIIESSREHRGYDYSQPPPPPPMLQVP